MMKKIVTLFFVTVLLACNNKAQNEIPKTNLIHNVGEALGTSYTIQYESTKDFHEEIKDIYRRVNQSMSTYLPDSDISKINHHNAEIIVDSLFVEVFQASLKVWEDSGGFFDPTVGPLINAYGFGPEKKLNEIDDAKIDSLLTFVGLEKVSLTVDGKIVKQDPRIYLDFNAIAKGYTVDLVGRLLESKRVKNYLVEIGGELLSKGVNPDKNTEWVVAIDNPEQLENRIILKTLKLKDIAMATSGNYRKFYIDSVSGEKFVHSINPKTGKAQKNNILSVSVLAKTCMYADAYATAFMVMDFEASKALLSKENLEAYIVYLDSEGEMQEYATEGFLRNSIEY